jgi:excisionase family DNA binding protein
MNDPIPPELASVFAEAPPLLTVSEAAFLLSMTTIQVSALCNRHRLRHYRLGGTKRATIRIAKDDLAKYLKQRQVRVPKPARRRPSTKALKNAVHLMAYGKPATPPAES